MQKEYVKIRERGRVHSVSALDAAKDHEVSVLRTSWGRLGACCVRLGASRGCLGGVLGASGGVLGCLGGLLGGLVGVLGPSWWRLEAAWDMFDAS